LLVFPYLKAVYVISSLNKFTAIVHFKIQITPSFHSAGGGRVFNFVIERLLNTSVALPTIRIIAGKATDNNSYRYISDQSAGVVRGKRPVKRMDDLFYELTVRSALSIEKKNTNYKYTNIILAN